MKKGFTLVEVLTVIVILSILSMIVFPNVVKIINKSKDNLYQTQLRELEMSTKNFALDNQQLLDKNHLNDTYISLETLKQSMYIKSDKISNPKTSKEMNGCMRIYYNHDTNQYNYEYIDNECTTDSGYIITYKNGSFKKEEINPVKSTYDKILEDNTAIYLLGNTESGLYDIGDEYIFRGTSPANYAELGGEKYRIISLNKTDKTIKLIKEVYETSVYSSTNNNSFVDSTISKVIFPEFIANKKYSNKIVDSYKWPNGILDITQSIDYDTLLSVENTNYVQNRLGLINVSDYVIASLDTNCYKDITSSTCKNSNYLYDLFKGKSLWTMNNSTSGNVITLEDGVITNHVLNSSTDSSYRIYHIVVLKKNVTISKGIGTSSSPYKVE